jgi:hypothetical protein
VGIRLSSREANNIVVSDSTGYLSNSINFGISAQLVLAAGALPIRLVVRMI